MYFVYDATVSNKIKQLNTSLYSECVHAGKNNKFTKQISSAFRIIEFAGWEKYSL
jgi:hypothetical protein